MAEKKGWIHLHRKIQDCLLWDSPEPFDCRSAWIDLILLANHEDKRMIFDGQPITVKKGQRITSVRTLAQRWHWGNNKTLKYLRMLEEENMIIRDSDKRRTLLTIVNYDVYNDMANTDGTQTEHKRNTDGTLTEHKRNTDESQTRMIKNDKNEKNEKNDIIPPTPLEGGEKKKRKKCSVLFQEFLEANPKNGLTDKLKTALAEWMEYKDQRKDTYAPLGMKKQLDYALNGAREHGEDAVVDVINKSIANNYQGITWDALNKMPLKKSSVSTQSSIEDWAARREREQNDNK